MGWGTLVYAPEVAFGFFRNNVWQDSGNTNDGLEPIAIMLQDEEVPNEWRARQIMVWCSDGFQLTVEMPTIQDIGGPGFVDAAGRKFSHGFWVGKDGRLFHDKELTQPVP